MPMVGPIRLGFLVNPIAGMGGAVGLKGTDGEQSLNESVKRGARKVAAERAAEALSGLVESGLTLEIFTCSGEMGESTLAAAGLPHRVTHEVGEETTAADTKEACKVFRSHECDLIVFVGGDGTARDVISEVGETVPIIGVPSGVKMHSAVFANTPKDLADIIRDFADSGATQESEVLDVDEHAFREGVLKARLYGIARVPISAGHVQSGKQSYTSGSAEDEAAEIGQYISETMEKGRDYILGPGSTTAAIAQALGCPKTLLGVDVYRDGSRILADASESDLMLRLGEGVSSSVIVSPIGAQGFFFGRGNQQISPRVIRRVGVKNVIVVATPSKLASTKVLRVDTSDNQLDLELKGAVKVVTGYKRRKLVKVE